MNVPNRFAICGAVNTTVYTVLAKLSFSSILSSLGGDGNIPNEIRMIPASASCAILVSCTRSPSNLRGMVSSIHRAAGNEVVTMFNYNNSESGAGHPGVNGVMNSLTSITIMASSGPQDRSPRLVISSILRNVRGYGTGVGILISHARTVECTLNRTGGNSIILLTNGKRRACRVLGANGVRCSRHRIITNVLTRKGSGW